MSLSNSKILLIGAPGSGKGSISKILVDKFKLVHISTGNLFREKIKKDRDFAEKIQNYVKNGLYVPDEITNDLLSNFISQLPPQSGYILDGYPRTLNQLNFMNENKIDVDKVFYLEIKPETIVSRLSQRLFCSKCQKSYNLLLAKPKVENTCDIDGEPLFTRPDDRPEIVKLRIEKFNESVTPIVDYYKKHGKIHYLNVERSLDEIVNEIEKCL
ncbi:adenylate kinase family protein [Mesomycoplasma ovipneumoniae]|uniref:adenylate kinase family protein n=1 Tax=Mesomycoplasma ovipneumoniae TaxID=29562 RepID=UPI000248CBFB|nr:nucleoside monophosphate kinase [Mesomycoplasma ovipneumoniae]